jgi:UDP-3-O-acyl N-acetylglucosamine deacetylase
MNGFAKQKTIAKGAVFSGKALQTGRAVEVVCEPAPPDSGIIFVRADLRKPAEIKLGKADLDGSYKRRSTIGRGKKGIQTVEHFLAALWALGITNIRVSVKGAELPAMDGSSAPFLAILKNAGIAEQKVPAGVIDIAEPIVLRDGEKSLSAYPFNGFGVSYHIDYGIASIKEEEYYIALDGASFEKEIAPARTFCLKKEALILRLLGVGRGATCENTLIMAKTGPVGTTLRFPNEPVRHKILDLVGDLYLLGCRVRGRFVAEKSGHALNRQMVKAIYDRYLTDKK